MRLFYNFFLLFLLVFLGVSGINGMCNSSKKVSKQSNTPSQTAAKKETKKQKKHQHKAKKETKLPIDKISLPEGFKISVFAENVPNARAMALGDNGTLFVGSRGAGNLYALLDNDKDYQADSLILIKKKLNMPTGVAYKDGDLYVAEVDKIWRFDDIEQVIASNIQNNEDKKKYKPTLVTDQYPSDEHHGWKYLRFGPDDKLYVPVGAPCNICNKEEENKIYSTITRIDKDGSNQEIYAHGIRNTVGFDWHPETGEMWFTDNGRDWYGDDKPPDELNKITEKGQHFGFPYCHGGEYADDKFANGHTCEEFVSPVQQLGPHVAALGMRFYTGDMFPETYKNQVFIAEHGSWNRSTKIGYRVTLVNLDENGNSLGYKPFADGWLYGETVWGRPADIMQLPDGSLLVSDDKADAIYRITYNAE